MVVQERLCLIACKQHANGISLPLQLFNGEAVVLIEVFAEL